MALDWFQFLRQNNIPYTTTGPNASRGRVNIKCPFCGSADPSEHMGISIRGSGWSCWRNDSHRGVDNARLVAQLLRCSQAEAKRIVGGSAALPTDRELKDTLRERLGVGMDDTEERVSDVELYSEFKSLANGSRFADQFLDY